MRLALFRPGVKFQAALPQELLAKLAVTSGRFLAAGTSNVIRINGGQSFLLLEEIQDKGIGRKGGKSTILGNFKRGTTQDADWSSSSSRSRRRSSSSSRRRRGGLDGLVEAGQTEGMEARQGSWIS